MYKTKQKKSLINFLENHKSKQVSISEIISQICPNGTGKSTIYRLISKMVDDGIMIRIRGNDGRSVLYQYAGENNLCHEHFHLKCTDCGKLIHLDCNELSHIGTHISKEHNFLIDSKKTVLYGTCFDCMSQG